MGFLIDAVAVSMFQLSSESWRMILLLNIYLAEILIIHIDSRDGASRVVMLLAVLPSVVVGGVDSQA